jgi:putative membrane protein
MMWGNGMWGGWMWLVMTAGTVAFWVVVVLVVRALLPGRPERSGDAQRPDALTILRERLARGEVTVEEYEQRRRHLIDGR